MRRRAALVALLCAALVAPGCRALAGYSAASTAVPVDSASEQPPRDGLADAALDDSRAPDAAPDAALDSRAPDAAPDAAPDEGALDTKTDPDVPQGDGKLPPDLRPADTSPPCTNHVECPSSGPCAPGYCDLGRCTTVSLPIQSATVASKDGENGTLTRNGGGTSMPPVFDEKGVEAGCREVGAAVVESRGVLRFANPLVSLPINSVVSSARLTLCHLVGGATHVALHPTTLPSPPTSVFAPTLGVAIAGFPSYTGVTVAGETTPIPTGLLQGASIDFMLVLESLTGCGPIAIRRRYTASPFTPTPTKCASAAPTLTVDYCVKP